MHGSCCGLASLTACSPAINCTQAIRAVLSALRPTTFGHSTNQADTAACSQLRSLLLGKVPAWAHSVPAGEPQFAVDLVTAAMPDIEYMLPEDLAVLITSVLTGMEQKQPHACILLELLPACLAALQSAPAANTSSTQALTTDAAEGDAATDDAAAGAAAAAAAGPGGGAAEVAKHRDAAIHRLSHCQWQADQVCQILTVLKGMALTSDQLKGIMAKAIRAARCVCV